MVEVKAEVLGGPVLLAGDTVKVNITVSAPPLDQASSVQSSEACEIVAWGSAQIHCICTINDKLVHLPESSAKPAEENAVTNAMTSFAPWRGERGHLVLATKPKILFCDLQLLPGQTRTFLYKENLTVDAPPTHRGQLVKYAYKVTVGTQRLGTTISLLRLPIRVIVVQGLSQIPINSETEELAPTSPFLHTPQRDTVRHAAFQQLQNFCTQKNVSQFNISHSKGHVVTLTIYKTSYRLGEDIVASFNFTDSLIPCVQYSATLQSEEDIPEKCRVKSNQPPVLMSYSKIHEVCLGFSRSNFVLPVPLHLTPTFATDIVSLQWQIHFEFVLNIGSESNAILRPGVQVATEEETPEPSEKSTPDGATLLRAPPKLQIETLIWDLPISIYPTSPRQLSQALVLPFSCKQQL